MRVGAQKCIGDHVVVAFEADDFIRRDKIGTQFAIEA